jgi:hypothetical protein
MTGSRRVPGPITVVVTLVVVSAITACSSGWRVGERPVDDLDRAAIIRCRFEPVRQPLSPEAVADLAGDYNIFMVGDRASGVVASGRLALAPATGSADGIGAAPTLVGTTTVDPSELGAVVPGDATSADALAPGVGVYVFSTDDTSGEWTAVLRLGAESNRRDRQRFDGAHTTLRISSIGDAGFGGTWTSAESANNASGDFCAVRS